MRPRMAVAVESMVTLALLRATYETDTRADGWFATLLEGRAWRDLAAFNDRERAAILAAAEAKFDRAWRRYWPIAFDAPAELSDDGETPSLVDAAGGWNELKSDYYARRPEHRPRRQVYAGRVHPSLEPREVIFGYGTLKLFSDGFVLSFTNDTERFAAHGDLPSHEDVSSSRVGPVLDTPDDPATTVEETPDPTSSGVGESGGTVGSVSPLTNPGCVTTYATRPISYRQV